MPKLQGIIFDLDGTLIDSAPDIAAAINATLTEHGLRHLTLDEVKRMVGDGLQPTLERALMTAGGDPADARKLMSAFTRHYYALTPDAGMLYPHVREVLDRLQDAGIPMGVCTNKLEASTLRLLDRLDLRRYFGFVAGVDTFAMHKPHPGHVQGVIDGLGLTNEGCVMVGDSPNDVLAGQGCRLPCIVVTQGYGTGVESYGAEAVIKDFGGLAEALGGLSFTI